jgi:NAD(P)-dependent dehydrogenase (short-subunit alcohol dehydrogenase family)
MVRFDKKRALITGGGRGIGKEIALLLNKLGAKVVVFDRIQEDLEALKKEIGCETVKVDLLDTEATAKAARQVLPIDLLVNSAGVVIMEPFLETSTKNFEETLGVNVRAMLVVSQVVARDLVARKAPGSIVNISSVANTIAFQDHTTYCISKGGVDQLTRCMAMELGHHKIRTNAVAPVMTMTPMGRKAWSDPAKSGPMLASIPLGRFNETIDVANVVAMLLARKPPWSTALSCPWTAGS